MIKSKHSTEAFPDGEKQKRRLPKDTSKQKFYNDDS